jgi:hypothetical protein
MDNNGVNHIKQNLSIKQYMGWFMSLFLPFTMRGIMDITKLPLIAAVIYWFICGLLLRYLVDKKLPYCSPKIKCIRREIVSALLLTLLSIYFYISDCNQHRIFIKGQILNSLIFVLLNGCFQQLVWINIFEFSGARIKLSGFIAVFIHIVLINLFFWNNFIAMPSIHTTLFIMSQGFLIINFLIIYMKTDDITILSLQNVVYNLIIVFVNGFGCNPFIYMK